MLFNSFAYAIFLPIVFGLYWFLSHRFRWVLLLVASYFFYMCSTPKYCFLIFSITLLSYLSALLLDYIESKKKRKTIVFASVTASIGILIYFKYINFFCSLFSTLVNTLGIDFESPSLNILLPVGISFYTFQSIGYVVDVYKGKTKAEYHFGKFAAFVSFFPQLVAGPIERSDNLIPQIKQRQSFNYDKAIYGVKLMLWGYYKKLVIADVLSEYVQRVYDNPSGFSGCALLLSTFFFTIQIYCDFSGYSDIAIGTAKLFGIDLLASG